MTIQKKKIKLPSKKFINLAAISKRKVNLKFAIPAIIIISVGLIAFAKFGVIDRIVALATAEGEVASIQRQIDEGYERIDKFGDIVELYAHYTYSDMTPEELDRVDRIEIIDVMNRVLLPTLTVDQWSIKANTLSVSVCGDTLQQINTVSQTLLSEPIVEYCTVTYASTENSQSGKREAEAEYVRAQITVNFIPVSQRDTAEEVTE